MGATQGFIQDFQFGGGGEDVVRELTGIKINTAACHVLNI